MNVGNSLKIALVRAGMSQQELAKKMQCGTVWVSRLANKKTADLKTIESLAAIFGMKVSEFLALGED